MTKHSYSLAILSHHKCATNWLRSICRELGKQDLIAVDIVGGQESDSGSAAPSAAPVLLDVNALFAPNRRVDVAAQPTGILSVIHVMRLFRIIGLGCGHIKTMARPS